jgi:predicted metalloprotease
MGHYKPNATGRADFVVEAERYWLHIAIVWAHHADRIKHIVESGDIEEALRAAGAVGDDNLERQTHGYVVPDSFTHGISEQRVPWFRKGYETGDTSQGDNFRASEL